jgi:hypothetical protein
MRPLGKIAAALGVIGAIGISGVLPASADWYYEHHHHLYYNYYGGGGWACRPGWTVQGGVCKPYRYGPWDTYGYYNWFGYR